MNTSGHGSLWTARTLIAVSALFLLFDATIHILEPQPVVDAFAQLGYPLRLAPVIGAVEIVCVALYLLPRTAPLGAVLLTGLLGGAVSAHMRAGGTIFESYGFPVLMGALIWGGLLLREAGLRAFIPVRR